MVLGHSMPWWNPCQSEHIVLNESQVVNFAFWIAFYSYMELYENGCWRVKTGLQFGVQYLFKWRFTLVLKVYVILDVWKEMSLSGNDWLQQRL